ncbi:gram-negative bacterial tonB family protein [Bacteroides fragilis str. J-143-4]|nr:gram-negative bacterial tonB family protein [Bacteroides fragilis str. J-143-4]
MRSVEPSLDKEALRIIKMLPQWKPGTLKGKAVKVKYTVQVTFKLK